MIINSKYDIYFLILKHFKKIYINFVKCYATLPQLKIETKRDEEKSSLVIDQKYCSIFLEEKNMMQYTDLYNFIFNSLMMFDIIFSFLYRCKNNMNCFSIWVFWQLDPQLFYYIICNMNILINIKAIKDKSTTIQVY